MRPPVAAGAELVERALSRFSEWYWDPATHKRATAAELEALRLYLGHLFPAVLHPASLELALRQIHRLSAGQDFGEDALPRDVRFAPELLDSIVRELDLSMIAARYALEDEVTSLGSFAETALLADGSLSRGEAEALAVSVDGLRPRVEQALDTLDGPALEDLERAWNRLLDLKVIARQKRKPRRRR